MNHSMLLYWRIGDINSFLHFIPTEQNISQTIKQVRLSWLFIHVGGEHWKMSRWPDLDVSYSFGYLLHKNLLFFLSFVANFVLISQISVAQKLLKLNLQIFWLMTSTKKCLLSHQTKSNINACPRWLLFWKCYHRIYNIKQAFLL